MKTTQHLDYVHLKSLDELDKLPAGIVVGTKKGLENHTHFRIYGGFNCDKYEFIEQCRIIPRNVILVRFRGNDLGLFKRSKIIHFRSKGELDVYIPYDKTEKRLQKYWDSVRLLKSANMWEEQVI